MSLAVLSLHYITDYHYCHGYCQKSLTNNFLHMIWSILVKTWVGQKENIISFCSVGKPLMQSAYCFFFSKTWPHLITMRVFIIYQMLKIILTIRRLYYGHINHIHSICAYYVAVTDYHWVTRIHLALHIWCKNL